MHLSYDSSKYTPAKVDFGTMLGQDGQVLTLALTDRAADVPIGICQVPSSGVQPATGSGTLATVRFTAQPFAGKSVSSADPMAAINKVTDLKIISQDTQGITLSWTEVHPGDTDNNGEANLADLVNIGKYLNQSVQDASDSLAVGMADTDGNGVVNVSDLTNLGKNLGSVVSGYKLFTDAQGSTAYGNGQIISRSNFYNGDDPVTKNHPVKYVFTALSSGSGSPTFSVAPVNAVDEATPGPVSNAAVQVIVDGPPDIPANLTTEGSSQVGSGKVKLTWTASTDADVAGYSIERKDSTPSADFVKIQDIGTGSSSTVTYTDSDPGLTDQAYTYRVRAVDLTSLFSDYSNESTATPYFPPPPSPPVNFSGDTGQASVVLHWDAPSDGSAIKFLVYREGPGESSFTMIKQTLKAPAHTDYTDSGLTAQSDYKYYVTSMNISGVESSPTATITCNSGEASDINITDVTADKLCHLKGGSEGVSNITISTDLVADSFQCSGPGVFTATATGGTWKPDASTPLGKNALMLTATKGPKTSPAVELDMYVTQQSIKTQYGTNGHYKDDFNNPGQPQFPSVLAPSQPYRPLSYYANQDHVVFYNLWGVWCYWCKFELPDVKKLYDYYKDGGFQYVGDDDSGETISDITTYYQGNPNSYSQGFESYAGVDPAWPSYDPTGHIEGYPTTVLIDRDGMIRLEVVGALMGNDLVNWSTTISELTGVSPAKTTGFDN
jgi:hypothetical protein